jgi:hypothetical protein
MIACLDSFDRLERKLAEAETTAVASRLRCGTSAVAVSSKLNPATSTIDYSSKRAKRRGVLRRLRFSCKQESDGSLTFGVRTRSKRTSLRKLIGRRLVVGAYRSPKASTTVNAQTTFKRR